MRGSGRRQSLLAGSVALLAAVIAVVPGALNAQVGPPPTGGEPPAGDSARVTIYRDAYGIPHIEAGSARALAYGTGYALAQDRLFLTLAIRLVGQGRTAELLGEPALKADIAIRRDFYDAEDVQAQYERLSPERRAELQAYSDGFNRGMEEVMADPRRRPAAFDALGYRPEPWKPTDSISVLMLFTYAIFAGEGGAGQLRNAELLDRLQRRFGPRGGLRVWNDVLFRNDPRAPTPVPRGEGTREPRAYRRERLPGRAQQRLAARVGTLLARAADSREVEARSVQAILRRLPVPKIGSYAVAVSGRRTRSGGALLVGSPQAGISAPSVFWQLGQHAPGRACTGFTVPGLGPWTGIGWCNGRGWSLVAGNMGEQVDNYVEEVDPNDPRRYRFRGAMREMDVRTETFRVNSCAPPICSQPSPARTATEQFDSTVHGTVTERQPGLAVTQRRAQSSRWSQSIEAVAGWNAAASLRDFRAATDRATGTYNLVYGDDRGNIMYRFTGYQPIRAPGYDRRLPSPGTGEAEWRGLLRQREMPQVVNPRGGLLVSNQGIETKPASWWPNSSSVAVGQASRVAGNLGILRRAGRLDVPALEALNPRLLERQDAITPVFARNLESALRRTREPRLREALGLFREWARAGYPRVDADGDNRYDHPAIAIFGADNFDLATSPMWRDLIERVFSDELGTAPASGGQGRASFQAPGTFLGQLSTLKLALDGRRASRRLSRNYVDDIGTRPRRELASQQIAASLRAALGRLEQEFGTPDMRRWLREVPTQKFEALGIVAPPPIRGFDHGTYSQIVDPRAGAGRYILPPGNGSADSATEIAAAQAGDYPRHFVDQREIYERYGFLDMPHRPEQYRASPESVTELSYPG